MIIRFAGLGITINHFKLILNLHGGTHTTSSLKISVFSD